MRVNCDATPDELIDVIEGNRVYMPVHASASPAMRTRPNAQRGGYGSATPRIASPCYLH